MRYSHALMLILLIFISLADSQFIGYLGLRLRLPGRCHEGDFDCGSGQCVSVDRFHDGRPDCSDGSDEWCFIGHFQCGTYCVGIQHSFACMFHSKCDGSTSQPEWCAASKQKLCSEPMSFPCKGYGECVKWNWLMDGTKDCIDGSDEDPEYVRILEGPKRCHYNITNQPQPAAINYVQSPVAANVAPASPCPFCSTTTRPPPTTTLTSDSTEIEPTDENNGLDSVLFATLVPPSPYLVRPVNVDKYIITLPDHQPGLPVPIRPFTSRPKVSHPTRPLPYQPTMPQLGHVIFQTAKPTTFFGQTTTPTPVSGEEASKNNQITESTKRTQTPTEQSSHISRPVNVNVETEQNRGNFFPFVTHVDLGGGRGGSLTTHIDTSGKESNSRSTTENNSKSGHIKHVDIIAVTKQTTSTEQSIFTRPTPYKVVITDTGDTTPFGSDFFIPPVRPISQTVAPLRPIIPAVYPFSTTSYTWHNRGGAGDSQVLIPIVPAIAVPTNPPSTRSPKLASMRTTWNGPTVDAHVIGLTTAEPTPEITSSAKTTKESESTVSVSSSQTATPTTTVTASSSKKTSVSNHGSEAENCLLSLTEYTQSRMTPPLCDCDSGKMRVDDKCIDSHITMFKLKIEEVCGKSDISDELRTNLAHSLIQDGSARPSCIRRNDDGDTIVNVRCLACDLEDVFPNTAGLKSVKAVPEALNDTICSDSFYNHCHGNAVCKVDLNGLGYTCECKNGTKDTSHGFGRHCEGVPYGDRCVLLFGICLIVWLLFLLGFLFLVPLLLMIGHRLLSARRNNRVQPITKVDNKTSNTNAGTGTSSSKPNRNTVTNVSSIWDKALKNNARGASALAHSFVVNEFAKSSKRVSKTPQMSQVLEVDSLNEAQLTDGTTDSATRESNITSENVINVVPRKETDSAATLPGTVPGTESPVVEKTTIITDLPSTSGLPSNRNLPDNASKISLTESRSSVDLTKVCAQPEIPSSGSAPNIATIPLVEVPVEKDSKGPSQRTIWKSFKENPLDSRDIDRQESSSSLEELIASRFPGNTETTNEATRESPVDSSTRDAVAEEAVVVADESLVSSSPNKGIHAESTTTDTDTSVQHKPEKRKSQEAKLADMLGVTLSDDSPEMTIKDENDARALADMAELNMNLPLSPRTDSARELATRLEQKTSSAQLEEALFNTEVPTPVTTSNHNAEPTSYDVPLTIDTNEKEDVVETENVPEKSSNVVNTGVFIPKNSKRKVTSRGKSSRTQKHEIEDGTSEESDGEILFKQMSTLKSGDKDVFRDRKRRYRKPERQLSSISEKSAEIASEAAIPDYSISAPNTTRSLSDWHGFIPRQQRLNMQKKAGRGSKSDLRKQPLLSSPEIPDVSTSRSMERLYELERQALASSRKSKTKKSVDEEQVRRRERNGRKISSTGDLSQAKPTRRPIHSSQSTTEPLSSSHSIRKSPRLKTSHHSLISRKIATRRRELHTAHSEHNIARGQHESDLDLRSTRDLSKSMGHIGERPRWDTSPYRENEYGTSFLPPIDRKYWSTHNTPRRSKSRTEPFPSGGVRSGSSLELSPIFNPDDMNKPPKEDLWWGPPLR